MSRGDARGSVMVVEVLVSVSEMKNFCFVLPMMLYIFFSE